MKILILKPSSLGDVVHALPVLRDLRRRWPHAHITWWIYEGLQGLLEDPDVDEMRIGRRGFAGWWHMVQSLRNESWDWILDLQSLLRSASLGWLVQGNGRVLGLDLRREGAPLFHDESIARPKQHPHAVSWYRAVAEFATGLPPQDFEWFPSRQIAAKQVQEARNGDTRPLGLLMPGARWETKRWPEERFEALVDRLCEQFPQHLLGILGGMDEKPLGEKLARRHPEHCLDLTTRTPLPQLIEWIRLSRWMVTNDTGPMHIAAALDVPVVGLFGPTDPRQTGPYGQERHALIPEGIPCAPCFKRQCHFQIPHACMLSHSVESVLFSLQSRLREIESSGNSI